MDTDGAVKALIGGKSYDESQFNRAVTARRQPGSAFKPFIYLTALERGLTPDTVREDAPIQLKGWRPENSTHDYKGPVTLQQALALSLNTVSVRLVLEVGPKAVVNTRTGSASPRARSQSSIALGTSEVSCSNWLRLMCPSPMAASASFPMSSTMCAGRMARCSMPAPPPGRGGHRPRLCGMMNG